MHRRQMRSPGHNLYIDASLLGRVKATEDERKWYPGLNGNKSLTCECEALDPRMLVDIVEEHLKAHIDKPTRQHVLALEAEECERLKRQIGKLRVGRHGRELSLTPDLTRQVHDMRRLPSQRAPWAGRITNGHRHLEVGN